MNEFRVGDSAHRMVAIRSNTNIKLCIPMNPTPDSEVMRPRVPLQSDPSANWVGRALG
jgi:hypothetical protein